MDNNASQEFFDINIVSPERSVYSAPVKQALIPAAEGYMGVLPGHAPVIASLQDMAILSIYEDSIDSPSKRFVVSSGFIEVLQNRSTVLADKAVDLNDVTLDSLERDITELEKKAAGDDADECQKEIAFKRALQEVIRNDKKAA